MSRLANRIDSWLLRTRDRQLAYGEGGVFRSRKNLIWYLLIWLHAWHAYEKRQQRERDYEVRDRNRLRRRELEGGPVQVSEDAWQEAGLDAKLPQKKQPIRPLKRWDFERKPGTSLGLAFSRTLLVMAYGSVLSFVVGTFLLIGGLFHFCVGGNLLMMVKSKLSGPTGSTATQQPPVVKKPPVTVGRFLEPPGGMVAVDDKTIPRTQISRVQDVEFISFAPFSGSAEWMAWTADGRGLYLMHRVDGKVTRLDVDPFVGRRSLTLHKNIYSITVSAAGVLVVVPPEGVYLLDADRLDVKVRIDIPRALKVFSAPVLMKAVVTTSDNTAIVLDLEKREMLGECSFPNNSGTSLVLSPDGKYLFKVGNGIWRYRLEGGKITEEESGPDIVNGATPTGINLSADGQYVCLPSENANRAGIPNHPTVKNGEATYVYAADDLKKPSLVLQPDAKLRGVAFDLGRKHIYGTNRAGLTVYDDKGQAVKTYAWPPECKDLRGCYLNPKERKLLLTANDLVCVVEWR